VLFDSRTTLGFRTTGLKIAFYVAHGLCAIEHFTTIDEMTGFCVASPAVCVDEQIGLRKCFMLGPFALFCACVDIDQASLPAAGTRHF